MQRNTQKCRKMQWNAVKCREIQRNVEKCSDMKRNAEKYSEMQKNAEECRGMLWNVEKCRKCRFAFMTFMTHGNVIFDITQSKIIPLHQSTRPMKVKMVKLLWETVGNSEMNIIWCISQTMWNQTKNSMKQLKQLISLASHWFSVEIIQNGPDLCKRKRIFLKLENLSRESWCPEFSKSVIVFYAASF